MHERNPYWRNPYWLNTATGRRFNFLHPRAEDIDIVDIAVALSHQARYAGHTLRHYSVAEHSVILADVAVALELDIDTRRWALLHDAAEAYVLDVPWPLKAAGLARDLSRVEKAIMACVVERFELSATEPAIVKELNIEILDVEADALLVRHEDWPRGTPSQPRGVLVGRVSPSPLVVSPLEMARWFIDAAIKVHVADSADLERLESLHTARRMRSIAR